MTFATADFSPFAVADLEDDTTALTVSVVENRRLLANSKGATRGVTEGLPSGTRSNVSWHVEQNDDGDYVLVVYPKEGQTTAPIPSNFYANIRSELGEYADQLKELQVEDGITALNSNSVFAGAPFEKITLAATVTTIGNNAFQNCAKLSSVEMPGVTTLGTRAFSGCKSLTSLDFLPETLKTVNTYVFENCTGLTEVDLSGTQITTAANYMFSGCTNLTSVKLPLTVMSIYQYAFSGCTALEEADLSSTQVTSLPSSLFNGRSNLKTVKLPNTLTYIHSSAFSSCTSLENLDLSNTGVTNIDSYAFNNCTALKSIDLPTKLQTLGSYVFQNCTALESLDLSNTQLKSIPTYMVSNCQSLTEIKFPDGLTSISGTYAFRDCKALESVDLSNTAITNIAGSAFYNCTALQEVKLPETVTSMGTYVFQNCTSLTDASSVGLGSTKITALPNGTFYGCTGLKTADLSDTQIKTLGNDVFNNDIALEEVVLPETLTSLGTSPFNNCKGDISLTVKSENLPTAVTALPQNLKNVTYDATVDTVDGTAINKAINNGGRVTFRGPNDLSVTKASGNIVSLGNNQYSTGVSEEKPLTSLEGNYYVDAQGVVYKLNDDGTAELIYCPAGVTSLTVPETITSVAGQTYTVTQINSYALAQADDLTAVTFEKPEQVTIAPKTFTNSPVQTVNGEEAIDPNDFAAVSQLCDFPLKEDVGSIEKETSAEVNGKKVITSLTIINQMADDDNVYRLKTGETANLSFAINNEDNGLMNDSVVRIYIQTTGSGFSLGDYTQEGVAYSVHQTGSESYFPLSVHKSSIPGLYYYDITGFAAGDILQSTNPFSFPDRSSAGGTMLFWAEALTKEQAEKTPDSLPRGDYLKVEWATAPKDFSLGKSSASSSSPSLVGSGTADERIYVGSMYYNITRSVKSGSSNSTLGADYAVFMDYDDTLTPPEGFILTPEIKKAIEDGRVSYSVSSGGTTVLGEQMNNYLYFYVTLANGTRRTVAYAYTSSYHLRNNNYYPELLVGEDGNSLRIRFRATNPYLAVNYNGDYYATSEFPTTTYQIYYYDRLFEADQSIKDENGNPVALYEEDGSLRKNVGRFTNTVTDTQHFSWSDDQEDTASAQTRLIPIEGALNLSKSGPSGGYYTAGSNVSYTITLYNTSVVASRLMRDGYLQDELPAQVYIQPVNMESMFKSAPGATSLRSIVISPATLCVPQNQTVTTTTGGTAQVGTQFTSGDEGHYTNYDGMETVDDSRLTGNATITITYDEGSDRYTIVSSTGESLTAAPGELDAKLNALGYIVTSKTRYKLTWDMNDTTVYAGQYIYFYINANIKDTFMLLEEDELHQYYAAQITGNANTVYAYQVDPNPESTTGYKEWQHKSSNSFWFYREIQVSKAASVDGENQVGGISASENDVIDYTVSFGSSSGTGYRYKLPLPLTDKVQGAQVLLVPVSGNENATLGDGVKLSEAGLKTYNDGSTTYYMLTKPGVYHRVKVGGYLADSITVTKTTTGLNSLIKWYFVPNSGSSWYGPSGTVKYKVLLSAAETGVARDGVYEYAVANETWLNDHETHRLYAGIDGEIILFRFIKRIVEKDEADLTQFKDPETLVDFSNIHENEQIKYKISIRNEGNLPGTIRGTQMYDELPQTRGAFAWTKELITDISYRIIENGDWVGEGSSSCTTTGRDYWFVDNVQPSTGATIDGQYYIHWNEDFRLDLVPGAEVWVYVTLQFPTKDVWNQYVAKNHGTGLYNTFFLDGVPTAVEHALAAKGQVILRKGVYATTFARNTRSTSDYYYYYSKYTTSSNGSYWFYTDRNDRSTYANGPTAAYEPYIQNSVAHYYTVLYNGGDSRLYLEDLQDHLPRGFRFRGLTYCYQYNDGYAKTSTNTIAYGTEYGGTNSFATVKDPDRSVVYVNAQITATASGVSNGYQSVTFRVTKPGSSYSVSGRDLKYDSLEGKYYLAPGEAIRFNYSCYVAPYAKTDDIATNTIAMPYYDYLHVGVMADDVSKVSPLAVNGVTNNDGGCAVVKNNLAEAQGFSYSGATDATEWLISSVSLRRAPIIPGIQKTVGGTSAPVTQGVTSHTIQGSTNGTFGAAYNGAVEGTTIVNWRLRLYNESEDRKKSEIYEYTLSDTVQADYAFCGEVFLRLCSSSGSVREALTLFRIGQRTKGDTQVPIQIIPSASSWSSSLAAENGSGWTTITVNGSPVRGGSGNYIYYTVQLLRDETTNYETLIIKFLNPRYAIRPTEYGELGLHTVFNSTDYETSKPFLNKAQLHVDIPYSPDSVAQGRNVTDSSGNVLDGADSAIESSATVTMIKGFAAHAVKNVTEIGNASNTASSDDESKNSIPLPDKTTGFRYDLKVTTPEERGTEVKRIAIIDALPEPGDHSPMVLDMPRNSAFTVSLMDDPSFTVSVTRGDNNKTIVFDRDQYSVELSTKTEFSKSDWEAEGTGWVELTDAAAQQDLVRTARSFRIIIKDETGESSDVLFPLKSVIRVSFNARIDDPENKAKPGDLAWNSFGYAYTVAPFGTDMTLSAEPLVVGIRYPEVPTLTKQLVDEKGQLMAAVRDMAFEFVIYSGEAIPALKNAEKLSMQQIARILAENERDVYYAPLTVPEGESSVSRKLMNGVCWTFRNGKWEKTEKVWEWTHGDKYTVLECHPDVQNFRLRTLVGKSGNNIGFTQNGRTSLALTGVNEHFITEYGELEITKTLSRYESSEAATFVFQVEATKDGEVVYTNVAALTFTGAGTKSVRLKHIPVGANVTVKEVYTGAAYELTSAATQSTVILSPDDPAAPAGVSFTNDYDGSGKSGHGIVNEFQSVTSGEDEYQWILAKNPDLNNG